jgi:hypothetical protein
VDDGRLVDGVGERDGGVDAVAVVHLTLDNGLRHVAGRMNEPPSDNQGKQAYWTW